LAPDHDDEKGVTYREMAEYVKTIVEPVIGDARAHDAWHRGRLEAEAGRIRAQVWTALSIIVAAAAVVVAAVHH
jgi:hypothetical protein